MIVVTGASGFIGSCLVAKLNSERFYDLVLVDDFSNPIKEKNLEGKRYSHKIHRDHFHQWLQENHRLVQFIFHLGARTDTAEFNKEVFDRLNLNYSKAVWNNCVEFGLPLVYASSGATYGNGENGYNDNESTLAQLHPMNPYGLSKHEFDLWAVAQKKKPYFWAGLKFFNVYGPNEYHKGRMASVVYHAFNSIAASGEMSLFRSHKPEYNDGEQMRDFIYVKDVTEVCYFFMHLRKNNGIYNLGTGKARTWIDLLNNTFSAMNKPPIIKWKDIPEDIRDKYQYFTQANMDKLRKAGFEKPFTSLEEGVKDYVSNYLMTHKYY